MRNAIPFVSGPHTDAMHGSMVLYIGHATMRAGKWPWSVLMEQPDSDWLFAESEHWCIGEARSA
jgi:hypothetical protein